MATNLELKVRCTEADLLDVRPRVAAAGIDRLTRLTQRDTYFGVSEGRLKLREIRNENGSRQAELIGYRRADLAGARWSDYSRAELQVSSAGEVSRALELILGVVNVVEKSREVGIWRRTRIHLDRVAGRGCFVELETVTNDAGDLTAQDEMNEIARLLGLDAYEVVSGSYGDMPASETHEEAGR